MQKMLAALLVWVVSANAAADLAESLAECRQMSDDVARLACFDELAESAAGQPETPESVPAPVAAVPAQPPRQEIPVEPVAEDSPAERVAEDRKPGKETISARITAIGIAASGGRVITLDNGQVWRETGTSPSLSLDVGDEVRIKAGMFGSFRLFAEDNRGTRVKRVQ